MAPYRWRGPTPFDPQMVGFEGSGASPEDALLVAPTQQDLGAEDYMSMLPPEYADLSSYGPQRFFEASPPPDSPGKKTCSKGRPVKVAYELLWARRAKSILRCEVLSDALRWVSLVLFWFGLAQRVGSGGIRVSAYGIIATAFAPRQQGY